MLNNHVLMQTILKHLVALGLLASVLVFVGYQWRPTLRTEITNDIEGDVSGFYDSVERASDHLYRWTNGQGVIRFRNAGKATPLIVSIEADAWRDETRVFTATITVNGNPIGTIAKAGWRTWRFAISDPAILRADELIVGIHSTPWVPSQLSPAWNDDRKLGIQVESVELEPQWGDPRSSWLNLFTIPSTTQLVYGILLTIGTYLLSRFMGSGEKRAFRLALAVILLFAVCIGFFRQIANYHVAIGALAAGIVVMVAVLLDVAIVTSRDRAYFSRQAIAATVFFSLLTIGMLFQLVERMDNSVVGLAKPGDNFYYVWLVGWFQKALLTSHSPFTVPFLNYPAGWNLAYNEITPAMVLIALPISMVSDPILGYNFSILGSFVLSGLGMFWWVRRLTNNSAAGLIAGTIFMFAPYRMAHMLGHLNLIGTLWFPFYFMALGDLLKMRQWRWKSIGAVSVLFGLVGLTSQYYQYMTLVLSIAFVIGYLWLVDRRLIIQKSFWKKIAAIVIVAAPLVVLSTAPYLQIAMEGNYPLRSYQEISSWSASPTDFILPSNSLWAQWIEQHFHQVLEIESQLYVGLGALFLAVLALFKRARTFPSQQTVGLLVFSCLVAFVLALGTDLHWLGESVTFDVPTLVQQWYPHARASILLPGYWLYNYLPFYSGMRVWMRYGIYVSLFVSALAGIGAARILQGSSRVLLAAKTFVILSLVLVDFYPVPQYLLAVQGRPVDYWLAAQSGNDSVAEFPADEMEASPQAYYSSVRNKPFVGATFWAFASPQYRRVKDALYSFPSSASVVVLRELGVRWVIVDSAYYPDFDQTRAAIESLGLRFASELDRQYVYELQ